MEEKNNSNDKIPDGKITLKSVKQNVIEFIKFALIAAIIVVPIRMYIAQPFIVSGSSMFPTFHDGEYLMVDELSYHTGQPKRDDVIIFHYPKDPKKYFIKRIIGLPNETIIINDGKITIKNSEFPEGFELKENYINESFHSNGTYKNNENEYFVMGDNRNFSSDSRVWGKLPRDLIVGRAYLRLLPISRISYLPGSLK